MEQFGLPDPQGTNIFGQSWDEDDHDMSIMFCNFLTSYLRFFLVTGKAGGACTSALLQVLYNEARVNGGMSWVELLQKMRTELKNMGYEQIPQLSSSKMIRVREPMYIVPPGSTGRRRALLIGINYVGQQGGLGFTLKMCRMKALLKLNFFCIFRSTLRLPR